MDNEIYSNEDKGISISTNFVDSMQTTHVNDDLVKKFYMDYSGTYDEIHTTIPSWTTVSNAEIVLEGCRYIPNGNLSKYFTYEGWVNDTVVDQELKAMCKKY